MSERIRLNPPGFEGKIVEVITEELHIPEAPNHPDCLIDLDLSYKISNFDIRRFTVTIFDKTSNTIEGTIEAIKTSKPMIPITLWWQGKLQIEDGEEIPVIIPKYPTIYVDGKAVFALSREFHNITYALGLICWFQLEDGITEFRAPTLEELTEEMTSLLQPE